ncbi:unnamed protein product [Symbiodinium sp. CCMP2592]|nr:unnamed protein product [Symbiodinium sp. CCMP2592]
MGCLRSRTWAQASNLQGQSFKMCGRQDMLQNAAGAKPDWQTTRALLALRQGRIRQTAVRNDGNRPVANLSGSSPTSQTSHASGASKTVRRDVKPLLKAATSGNIGRSPAAQPTDLQ